MFAKIAVSPATYAIDKPYDYKIPEAYSNCVLPGSRVFVPFGKGNRVAEGIVLSVDEESAYPDCKEILRLADKEPLLTKDQLRLALFMRERYFCTVYDAVRVMLPAGLWFDKSGRQKARDKTREMVRLAIPAEDAAAFVDNKRKKAPRQAEVMDLLCSFEMLSALDLMQFTGAGKETLKSLANQGLIEIYRQEVLRRSVRVQECAVPLPILNDEQANALSAIRKQMTTDGQSGVCLLSGVTGSGKTSVYAHLIAQMLSEGQGAILLVPEIALTPQMLSVFSSWFGDQVAILHSGLSVGERYDEWKRIRRGDARLVIGTRSAVFSPIPYLGLVIIDEEQEDSYRSESVPRYDTREVARFRCLQEKAFVILGSATPDITTRYLAQCGEYGYHRLAHRFNEKPLPSVRIVDMKKELLQGNTSDLSMPLKEAILSRIEKGEQSILFLNRRGTNKLVTCPECGFIYRCPHCSVSMTWHANRRRMICHYCGTWQVLDAGCPNCGGKLSFFGAGTQRLAEELQEEFPGTEILRVDADSVSPLGSHQILFQRFVDEKIPIMIGTQMIAKGLNFENVTLVGIVSADQGLYSNDFRAGEKTFSVLAQVIGRCGRGNKTGEAVIQTFTPENEIICMAARQDYEHFYSAEIDMRRVQNAPPFFNWVALSASGGKEEQVFRSLQTCRQMLEKLLAQNDEHAELMGPIPFPVVKVSDRFRFRIQIRCRLNKTIRQILSAILIACSQDREMRNVYFYVENETGF